MVRRLARLAHRVLRSNLAELPYPYRLTYAVTGRCQARCLMCGIWQKPTADELTLAEIDAIFARADRFSWVNLTGGELFLREDIDDLFSVVIRRSRDLYLLNFPTNGHATERIVATVGDLLARTSVPRLMVTVSLDGPRDLHDRIRGLAGSWDRALETFGRLREMRSRRFSVFLGHTIQEANLHAFDETVAAARGVLGKLSGEEIHVNLAHVSGHYYANTGFAGIPDPREAANLLDRIAKARRREAPAPVAFLERRYQRLGRTYLATGTVPLACQAAAASCFIDPEGMVYPCTGFAAPIGSLREHGYDLYRIWETAQRHDVRSDVSAAACPGCWTPCEAYQTILAHLVPGRRGDS